MQTVTEGDAAVLLADSVDVSAGIEWLDADLTPISDLSDNLLGGSVERQMLADIHGTCRLELDTALAWGTVLVRPYQELSAEGVTVRFNCGVFTLTTPESPLGDDVPVYSVQGYDRLYFLQRPVGDTYYVDAGTLYLSVIEAVFDAAGLTGVSIDPAAATKTLPTAKVWPLLDGSPTTWLRIVNDLLAAINYRSVWCDADGLFVCEPYVLPEDREPEFTFDTGALTIVGQDRTLVEDVWSIPSRWVFVQSNREPSTDPTEGDGVFTYDLPDAHVLSAVSRGLVWPRVVAVDAADQASLEARGAVMVAADLRVSSTLRVTTGPFPAAGHADVITYDDPDLGVAEKVQAASWSLDLTGGDTSWVWERL